MLHHTRNHCVLSAQPVKSFIGYIPMNILFPPQYLVKEIDWRGHGLLGVPFDAIRAGSIVHENINFVSAGHLLAIMVHEWLKFVEPVAKAYCQDNLVRLSLCLDDAEQYKAFNLLGVEGVAVYRRKIGRASCRERVCQYV